MRWTPLPALAMTALWGCYNPDYSTKPCSNDDGCPTGYYCDTRRPSMGAAGSCSAGVAMPAADMAVQPDLGPPVPTEYMVMGTASFYLGSNYSDGITANDGPASQIPMHSFCAAEHEVTVAEYDRCVQANVCPKPAGTGTGCNYGIADRQQHPINCVELPQAQAFCQWINRRLPTEEEWEYAANGPTTSTQQKYAWDASGSGTFDPLKTCFNNGGTCPVGTKVRTYLGAIVATSQPGFYDLTGNVWEWTSSQFCNYSSTGPTLDCASPGRVVRGGSGFDTDSRLMRSTVRLGNAKDGGSKGGMFANSWVNNVGFRCFADVNARGGCGP
jgi:formylglycine-generating enzyme required for sulfatase activity